MQNFTFIGIVSYSSFWKWVVLLQVLTKGVVLYANQNG